MDTNRKATFKMICFSNAIAKELGIEIPNTDDFETISNFIGAHRDWYDYYKSHREHPYFSERFKKEDGYLSFLKNKKGLYAFWIKMKMSYI